jgi:hypothetical protein
VGKLSRDTVGAAVRGGFDGMCKAGRLFAELDDDDQALAAEVAAEISHNAFHRWITSAEVLTDRADVTTMAKHLTGQCRCAEGFPLKGVAGG